MSDSTKIQWCDHTASPWHGCQHATLPDGTEHPGCANCYAERMSKRNPTTLGKWGVDGTRIISKSFAANCRRWNAAAEKAGKRASVFPSLCDPFEDWRGPMSDTSGNWWHICESCVNPDGAWYRDAITPYDKTRKYYEHACGEHFRPATMSDARRDLFRVIDECPWLDFILLTKRPQDVRKMWIGESRPNVWLLYSASDQASLESGILDLLRCRDLVSVLGLSLEPLLQPVDLCSIRQAAAGRLNALCGTIAFPAPPDMPYGDVSSGPALDWVIVGGESGPKARPCVAEYVWDVVWQCRQSHVPCFVKQLGTYVRSDNINAMEWPEGTWEARDDNCGPCGARVILRDRSGCDPSEWPEDLRVREMPRC